MKSNYQAWLEAEKYDPNTVNAQMYRARRVEESHGDLDKHFSDDQLASLIATLRYSSQDKRQQRPNPSKIPFDGDIRDNLVFIGTS